MTVMAPGERSAKNRSMMPAASSTYAPRSAASRSRMVRGGATKKSPVISAMPIRRRAGPSRRT
ncbi:MAG: hypothetical protein MUE61_21990 [Vicinamibacterales bacterium]|nr:hypothetical protein [Vicinamibacterales bacterium]